MPQAPTPDQELMFNATVDLEPPSLLSISPAQGAGGTVVTITGRHLAVVREVTFGGVPATNVSGDNERITATAPARAQGGPVDIQVTTAGGTSGGVPLDVFTYPASVPPAPTLDSLRVSPTAFRPVNAGGSIFAVRIGATVTYRLSTAATTTFTVKRAKAGRRVGRRCVAPTRANRRRARCTRLLTVRGSFPATAVAGSNRLSFSGRMNRRALAPGSYRLYAQAANAGGKSKVAGRAFRIVP